MSYGGQVGATTPTSPTLSGVGTTTTITTPTVTGVTAFFDYATTLAGAAPTDNVKIVAGETLEGNETVNGLIIANASSVIEAGDTLTITSGALVNAVTAAASPITGGTIEFGTAEGVITEFGAATATIQSDIDGTGGLTVTSTGAGVLNLPEPNSFTGQFSLNAGTLNIGSSTTLGSSSLSPVYLNAGTLSPTEGVVIANPVIFNNSVITFGTGAGTLNLTGLVTLNGIVTGTVTNTSGVIVSGTVTGSGELVLAGGSLFA